MAESIMVHEYLAIVSKNEIFICGPGGMSVMHY